MCWPDACLLTVFDAAVCILGVCRLCVCVLYSMCIDSSYVGGAAVFSFFCDVDMRHAVIQMLQMRHDTVQNRLMRHATGNDVLRAWTGDNVGQA
jgi:hypothetical protein